MVHSKVHHQFIHTNHTNNQVCIALTAGKEQEHNGAATGWSQCSFIAANMACCLHKHTCVHGNTVHNAFAKVWIMARCVLKRTSHLCSQTSWIRRCAWHAVCSSAQRCCCWMRPQQRWISTRMPWSKWGVVNGRGNTGSYNFSPHIDPGKSATSMLHWHWS